MFEKSLVESSGSIRTRSRWYAVVSFLFEAVALAVMILIPYIYPAALPPHALASLLVAPPPPLAPASAPISSERAHASVNAPVQLVNLAAPTIIPNQIHQGDSASAPPQMNTNFGDVRGSNATSLLGATPPLPPVPPRPKASGPVRVSSGVAAGRLLAPIQPTYPAIAIAARVQGRVVIEAIISKQGFVKQAQILSGQPMLAQAALEALSRARYQPYKLNGQPVEVATTINIDFILGN
ncbi:MAG: energy transducer TonB [Acidobacteriaceae bacterium]